MSEKLTTALLTFAGTFVTALIAAGFTGATDLMAKGWLNAIYGPGLQAVLMALIALGYQAPPVQRLMGRRP